MCTLLPSSEVLRICPPGTNCLDLIQQFWVCFEYLTSETSGSLWNTFVVLVPQRGCVLVCPMACSPMRASMLTVPFVPVTAYSNTLCACDMGYIGAFPSPPPHTHTLTVTCAVWSCSMTGFHMCCHIAHNLISQTMYVYTCGCCSVRTYVHVCAMHFCHMLHVPQQDPQQSLPFHPPHARRITPLSAASTALPSPWTRRTMSSRGWPSSASAGAMCSPHSPSTAAAQWWTLKTSTGT